MFGRRIKRESDLERELRSHLEMETEERRETGLSAEDARHAASRSFGNVQLLKEITRETWGGGTLDRLVQDLRFAARAMLKNPGVTVMAFFILALGVGANTAIFSVVENVLLRPLPYEDADRLVMLWGYDRAREFDTDQVSLSDFNDWKVRSHAFSSMAASTDAQYTLTGRGEPISLLAYQFSPEYFSVLGVHPLLGRTFVPGEDQPGRNRVTVLSYRLWKSRFGGDRAIVGKSIRLDGAFYQVVGVMPSGVEYPGSTELWTPLTIPAEAQHDREYRFLRVVARLRTGVSMQQAQVELNGVAAQLARDYPATNKEEDATHIVSLRQTISGDIRPALLVLLCAVALLLLIACANVANLLLVRTAARRKEIAVRGALGASRLRLLRQFLTESLALGLVAGTGGLFLALFITRSLLAMFPANLANVAIPRLEDVPIDLPVLLFCLATSLLTSVIFGAVPAIHAARQNASLSIKSSERALAGGMAGRRFRNGLLVAETALSLILLIGAGLCAKSFSHLVGGDVGFSPAHVFTFRLLLPPLRYATGASQRTFHDAVIHRLQAIPGVQAAGSVTFLPLSGWWGTRDVSLRSGALSSPAKRPAIWSSASPGYFQAMRIPLLKGRSFAATDASNSTPVAILSQTLARQLAPGGGLVGKLVQVAGITSQLEVIGIVGDVHQLGIASNLISEVYLSFAQTQAPILCVAVRTRGDFLSLLKSAQREVWSLDKDQPVSFGLPMEALVSDTLAPQRVTAILLGCFAAMALFLATVGVYGVISFSALQRTQEIGVRVALGAEGRNVQLLVLRQALAPVIAGIGIGLAGSFALTRLLSSLLYGVRVYDPLVFALTPLVLAGAAFAASYAPALRATRLDPVEALKYE